MFFTFLSVVTNSGLFAQNGFFLTASLEESGVGKPYYSFEQNNSVLAKNWIGLKGKDDLDILDNFEVSLQYHFYDHFGVAFNLGLRDKAVVVHDRRFMNSNNIRGSEYSGNYGEFRADSGNFNPNRYYFSQGFSGYYVFNGKDLADRASGPFLGYGIQLNKYAVKNKEPIGSYYHPSSSELLEFKTSYKNWYVSQYIEAGFFIFSDYRMGQRVSESAKKATRGFVGSLSVRYSFAGTYMSADYRVSKNGITEYTDRFEAGGSGLSVVLKLGGSVFGSRLDRKNQKVYDEALLRKELEKVRKDSVSNSQNFEERDLSIKDEMVVKNKLITISVWDHLKYDKDIISLSLDNQMVLENYTLQPGKKTIQLDLSQSNNLLVLYAISEGEEKPCTVAVLIDDGVSQRQVILNSTMTESEGIRIKVAN